MEAALHLLLEATKYEGPEGRFAALCLRGVIARDDLIRSTSGTDVSRKVLETLRGRAARASGQESSWGHEVVAIVRDDERARNVDVVTAVEIPTIVLEWVQSEVMMEAGKGAVLGALSGGGERCVAFVEGMATLAALEDEEKIIGMLTSFPGVEKAVFKVLMRLCGVSSVAQRAVKSFLSHLDPNKESDAEYANRAVEHEQLWMDGVTALEKSRFGLCVETLSRLVEGGSPFLPQLLDRIGGSMFPTRPSAEVVLSALAGKENVECGAGNVLPWDVVCEVADGLCEWEEASEDAKQLIRFAMIPSERVRDSNDLLSDREQFERCVFPMGLSGRVLLPKGSAVARVLDIDDLVWEVKGYLGKYRDERRKREDIIRGRAIEAVEAGSAPVIHWLLGQERDPLVRDSNRVMLAAAAKGRVHVLEELVRASANVDGDSVRNSPLFQAVSGGHVEAAEMLLENGARSDSEFLSESIRVGSVRLVRRFLSELASEEGWLEAAKKDSEEILLELMKAGQRPVVSKLIGGTSLLVEAVKTNTAAAVRALLEAGADPNLCGDGTDTPLICASRKGDLEMAEMLLEAGAEVNGRGASGDTALIAAATKGAVHMIKVLVEAKADLNIENNEGKTALAAAAQAKSQEGIELFLAAGANPNASRDGVGTALIYAVCHEMEKAAQMLIAAGAEVDAQNKDGDTALTLASSKNNVRILKMLIDADADLEILNKHRETALGIAVEREYEESVELLLASGAEAGDSELIFATLDDNARILKRLVEAGANVDSCGDDGSALELAVKYGNRECAVILIEAGASTESTESPLLHLAAKEGYVDIVRKLLERVDVEVDEEDPETDQTALHIACDGQSTELVEVLLGGGATVDLEDGDGKTALVIAASSYYSDARRVGLLLSAGANPNHSRDGSDPPLVCAIRRGGAEAVEMLIKAGADMDYVDEYGWTVLENAVRHGKAECVEVLLKAGVSTETKNSPLMCLAARRMSGREGAEVIRKLLGYVDVNAMDPKTGFSPLHIAAEEGNRETVEVLLSAGALLEARGRGGQTPLLTALSRLDSGKDSMAVYLLSAGANPTVVDDHGNTPMSTALRADCFETVQTLFKMGIEPGPPQIRTSALPKAVVAYNAPLVSALIRNGFNVNIPSRGGFTALCMAAAYGRLDIARLLVEQPNIKLNYTTGTGNSPLMLAVRDSRQRVSLSPEDKERRRTNRYAMVQLLLEAGADPNVPNLGGSTPLSWARSEGHKDVVQLLINHGADRERIP